MRRPVFGGQLTLQSNSIIFDELRKGQKLFFAAYQKDYGLQF